MTDTPRSLPPLADLTQDIAGEVPVELVQAWFGGDRTDDRARDLLEPYAVRGTAVCTDTAGLSRMTRDRPLTEVMRLVSRPKRIVHALGTTLGGHAIGTWAADNTEMLYPESVDPDDVVAAMLEVQRRVPDDGPGLGVCIHPGEFWHVAEGLWGPDAVLAEALAEDRAAPGEILLTAAGREALHHPDQFRMSEREDLEAFGGVWQVTGGPHREWLPSGNRDYPAPYHPDFRAALEAAGERKGDRGATLHPAAEKFLRDAAVVLIERVGDLRGSELTSSAADVLDGFLGNALLHAAVREWCEPRDMPWKAAGNLAILACDDGGRAVDTAVALRDLLADNGFATRTGVDWGPIMVFPMGHCGGPDWEFAGDPVNIASKMAEDHGRNGPDNAIYVSARAAAGRDLGGRPFRVEVARVVLEGVRLGPPGADTEESA